MTAQQQLWLIDHAPIMGGGQLLLLKLARHAAGRAGVSTIVVCPGTSELARQCRADGIELRSVAMPYFTVAEVVGIPRAISRLARVLRGAPPGTGLVASSAWSQALVSACAPALAGRPIVHLLTEQDTAKRRSARVVLRRVGIPVAIGANAARTYADALGRADVMRINNVLDDDELAAAAAAPRRMGAHATRRGEALPVVGVVARMIPEKGILELVDELASCRDAWDQAHLAGSAQDAAYTARVKGRIAARGLEDRVVMHGRVDDVAGFIDRLDRLIVPSIGTEGQPTTVLEALARGVGVVVRREIHSADYLGLPVATYRDTHELGAALAAAPGRPAELGEVARRFGVGQALDGLLAATRSPGALRRR